MQQVTIPLARANLQQLRQFALLNLGLEIPDISRVSREDLVALIRVVYIPDDIKIQLDELPAALEKKIAAGEARSEEIGAEWDAAGEAQVAQAAAKQDIQAPPVHVQEVEKDPTDPDHKANQAVTIFIDAVETVGGSDPVFVSVNGKGIWIPRSQNCVVKQKFVDALKSAVKRVGDQALDDAGNPTGEINWRDVPTYPWRIVETARAA